MEKILTYKENFMDVVFDCDYIFSALEIKMPTIYGTYKDGGDIYKNKKGFYVVQWNPKTSKEYKKYLKSFKPKEAPFKWNPKKKK